MFELFSYFATGIKYGNKFPLIYEMVPQLITELTFTLQQLEKRHRKLVPDNQFIITACQASISKLSHLATFSFVYLSLVLCQVEVPERYFRILIPASYHFKCFHN